MRFKEEISAWFPYPDDPDGAEFEFKLLTPGELAKVQDASFSISFDFTEDEAGKRIGKSSIVAGREKEIFLALKNFKNVIDADDTPVPCNNKTRLRPLREAEGFFLFYEECRLKLEKIKSDREKNLSDTVKD